MVSLCTGQALRSALRTGHTIALRSYVLFPGETLEALRDAAGRGARVRVDLDGAPPSADGALARFNEQAARALRAAGATVVLHPHDPREGDAHLKAAVVDGRAFFAGRNWVGGSDTIVTSRDPRVVAEALSGASTRGEPRDFTVDKRRALALEASVIARSDRVDVESESFGPGAVSRALFARLRSGARVRLIVAASELGRGKNAREARALDALARAGADIRLGCSDEKLAVAGASAWLGSANATDSGGADWGLRSRSRTVVAAARTRFAADWAAARTYRIAG